VAPLKALGRPLSTKSLRQFSDATVRVSKWFPDGLYSILVTVKSERGLKMKLMASKAALPVVSITKFG